MTVASSEASARMGNTVLYIGAILIPVFVLHTVASLVKKRFALLLTFVYVSALVLELLNFSGKLSDVGPMADFRYYTQLRPPYHFYVLHLYGIVLLLEIILWRESCRASFLEKRRLRFLFAGIGLGFLGGQTSTIMVYGINIFPYGNYFTWVYVIFVGYGMLKYQLMDFKVAFQKMALAFGIYGLLFLLMLPFAWPLFRSLSVLDPALVHRTLFFLALFSFALGAGPLLYAYFIRRNYWLRGHLTTGLTHELKSPLNAIQSASEIILDQLRNPAPNKAKALDYMDMIQKNAARLEGFVLDLLSVAKIQEGDVAITRSYVDLARLIRDAAEPYHALAAQKGVTLDLNFSDAPMLDADGDKIQQVVSNLLSNAVKFTGQGKITVALLTNKDQVCCSVKDDGCGIPAAHLERIFDRFFQGPKSTKGSGLGLAIAKAWVEAHGGKIWAESEGEGRGTKVTFTLPVQ